MVDKLAGAATAAPEAIAPQASRHNASGLDFDATLAAQVAGTGTQSGHTPQRAASPQVATSLDASPQVAASLDAASLAERGLRLLKNGARARVGATHGAPGSQDPRDGARAGNVARQSAPTQVAASLDPASLAQRG